MREWGWGRSRWERRGMALRMEDIVEEWRFLKVEEIFVDWVFSIVGFIIYICGFSLNINVE